MIKKKNGVKIKIAVICERSFIIQGYNLNARDEGGWTPLHEAVGALKLKNVRILVEAGANLNLRSNEGTISAEGERTVYSNTIK